MLVDWFTVGAQVLNFAILVWLMKRFLYKPILDAIDAREQHIAAALAQADAKKAEALRERDEFQHRSDELQRQRDALLRQATQDAEAERQRLLAEARGAADALGVQRRQALQSEARRLTQAVGQRTQQEVFSIARQALADLAASSLEERVVQVFIRRLQALEGVDKERLARALQPERGSAVVRSAFELPEPLRAAIQAAVEGSFGAPIALRFDTAPHLVSGIELGANGHKVGWSIEEYLTSLRAGVEGLLSSPSTAGR